jgi:hypothetical protein
VPKPTNLRPLSDIEVERSLVEDSVRVADDLRQLHTDFGGRPYRVFLVWLGWSPDMNADGIIEPNEQFIEPVSAASQTIGAGRPSLLAEIEILPTPRLSPLSSVRKDFDAVGLTERGSITVSQVTLSLSEDILMGLLPQYRDPSFPQQLVKGVSFFWEVRENRPIRHTNAQTLGSDYPTDLPGLRRKFVPVGSPNRNPYDFEWTVDLERADGERGVFGELPTG